ncbi:recombinase family protein [Clostridium perfringens]|uniref:recombinase family protein n=1 Tax=Clostridium perfringens TaxID=1502 RepID=UPI003A101233
MEALNAGDTLVVTTLDRFCRTVKEGLEIIDLLMDKEIRIHILNMELIECTQMGRLIVTNLLAFAEFERSMIVERTQTGKAIAKTKDGWKEGRPKVYTKEQLDNSLVNGGNRSYKNVERLLGISKSTLIREKY